MNVAAASGVESERPEQIRRPISGRWVVLVMFLFAGSVVGGFWTYWGLTNRPFRQLQEEILHRFPTTVPQVAGGRPDFADAESPRTLRIVVRTTSFDPNAEPGRAGRLADDLESLAWASLDRESYDRLEIVLFRKYAERRSAYWTRDRDLPKRDR